jgi:cell division transport system permease protein
MVFVQQVFTRADFILKETLIGLRRGGWMNWAAVSTLVILLFLFGFGARLSWQLQNAVSALGSQLEVSVYLTPEATGKKLMQKAETLDGVQKVTLQTKKDALSQLQKEMGLKQDLTQTLEGNPLVDSLRVKVATPEQVTTVAEQLKELPGVAQTRYGGEAANRLIQIDKTVRWIGLGVTGLLGFTAVAVITTTIRLVVLSRRKEIEVMQLVGAAPIWIYMPFLLEGLTLGLVAAMIAWGGLLYTDQFLAQQIQVNVPFIVLEVTEEQANLLPWILVGSGVGLGSLGSLLAVSKYLR